MKGRAPHVTHRPRGSLGWPTGRCRASRPGTPLAAFIERDVAGPSANTGRLGNHEAAGCAGLLFSNSGIQLIGSQGPAVGPVHKVKEMNASQTLPRSPRGWGEPCPSGTVSSSSAGVWKGDREPALGGGWGCARCLCAWGSLLRFRWEVLPAPQVPSQGRVSGPDLSPATVSLTSGRNLTGFFLPCTCHSLPGVTPPSKTGAQWCTPSLPAFLL